MAGTGGVRAAQVPLSLQMASTLAATAASEAAERAEMKRLVLSSAVEDERLPKVPPFAHLICAKATCRPAGRGRHECR